MEKAKEEHGDDPVVVVLEPARKAMNSNVATAMCGELRAAIAQILSVPALIECWSEHGDAVSRNARG
ncbi:MAG: hypothetical protein ACXVRS_07020 [Gaiellaceae bacterium]